MNRFRTPVKIRGRLRVIGCLVVLASSWFTACVGPRPHPYLRLGEAAAQTFAFAPVYAADVRGSLAPAGDNIPIELDASREATCAIANRALDDLAGRSGPLLGPSAVSAQLGPVNLARLDRYWHDPGPVTDSWRQQGLGAIGRQLGNRALVRTRLRLDEARMAVAGAAPRKETATEQKGRSVTVELEQFDAASGRLVGYASAREPVGDATAMGAAVDRALRRAWRQLLLPPAPATSGST